MARVKTYWPVIVGFVAALSWIVSQAVSTTSAMNEVRYSIEDNKSAISDLSEEIGDHQGAGMHPQLNDRLIRLEVEVKHIGVNQVNNFTEIRKNLKTIQDDLKRMRSSSP